ncbi:MAG: methyltransferase domain-containing protein [Bryobacteraceae bacterium]
MTSTLKAYKGIGMEGGMARWYDRTTRKGMPDFVALASRIAAKLPAEAAVLEVAPGPGFLSIELAKRGFDVRAVDISKTLIEIARRNAAAEHVDVCFELGNAAALPIKDASVDFVVCRAAFKNFTEPVRALAEMRRVLRPGGVALLIDMRRDVPVAELRHHVKQMDVGLLNRLFMMFVFRTVLIKRAYTIEQIRHMAAEAGWIQSRVEPAPFGFEAWLTR